jgi:hypothetical protein
MESVIINGKTINPEMVYETIKRVINLKYDGEKVWNQ